jgi:hypothetical protein
VTPLAEGADRIAASVALDRGWTIEALLPFMVPDYETTFSDQGTTVTFRRLLARATQRTELPGSLKRRNQAYLDVGLATLERADVLLAIWDGAPAAGRGGTSEIVTQAVAQRIPVVWVHAAEDLSPRVVTRKQFGPPPRLPRIVKSAQAMTREALRRP